jgi:TRAP transporter TAXI family solute receptor
MRDALKVWGPVVLLSALALLGAWWFVDPAPPRHLTLATGDPEGAYYAYGQRLRDILARDGIDVRIVTSSGSIENLQLLADGHEGSDRDEGVDLAFVQSGVGNPDEQPYLVALASLYFEPLWVFVRAADTPGRLTDLAGRRIAVGPEGSGTRELAISLLEENGISDGDAAGTDLSALSGIAAANALRAGQIEAMFRVSAMNVDLFRELMTEPGIALMPFARAGAYVRRHRYLSALTLPAGVLDLAEDIPRRDITLISPMANLVARHDMHPALVDLVLSAASEIFSAGGMFEEPGQFPSPNYVEFPLSPDAKRFFDSGLRFLHRILPFWAATIVGQLLVLILPVIAIVIPLIRIGPPLYRWQVRRRVVRWYRELRRIEHDLVVARLDSDSDARDALMAELDRLQDQVSELSVPTAYADQLYHLRLHVGFVRNRFSTASEQGVSVRATPRAGA